jgi:hypothetical protein
MLSEIASIVTVIGGASFAQAQSKQPMATLRHVSFLAVAACLVNLGILAASGFLREPTGIVASVHLLAGHLMLPLVAGAAGLWLGSPKPGTGRCFFPSILRLFFLLVLCFWCLSNIWTGYLGPSRIDEHLDPETVLRFRVAHQWAVPIIIGTMLLTWLRRLARWRGAAGNPRPA